MFTFSLDFPLKQIFSIFGVSGVHVFQVVSGLEWDDETGEVKGFVQYGYDGEDFMALDPNTFTWIALTPEAIIAKPIWEADNAFGEYYKLAFTIYQEMLMSSVEFGGSSLLRTGRIT